MRLFPQTFAGAVYNVCIRGCKRYPWRTHVFAFKVDQIGPGGCSVLRLRRTKGTPKSSVLFWTREKGGETRPIWVTVAPWFIYWAENTHADGFQACIPNRSLALWKSLWTWFKVYIQHFGRDSRCEPQDGVQRINRWHQPDIIKKPTSCRNSFNHKKLQYQPLETPVSNNIN